MKRLAEAMVLRSLALYILIDYSSLCTLAGCAQDTSLKLAALHVSTNACVTCLGLLFGHGSVPLKPGPIWSWLL